MLGEKEMQVEKNKFNVSYLDLYRASQDAMWTNSFEEKKEILNWVITNSEDEDIKEAKKITSIYIPNPIETTVNNIRQEDIVPNVFGYIEVYLKKVYNYKPHNVSIYLIDKLDDIKRNSLKENVVIFQSQNNEIDINKRRLDIRGVISVIGYSLEVMEIAGIESVEKYKNGILVLKAIDRVIDNKKQSEEKDMETILRNTGFGIEVLSKVLEQVIEDEKAKTNVKISSLSIRLVLEFFTGKKYMI